MPSRAVVLLAAVVTVQLLQLGCGLKLLSFNIENFSPKKFAKQGVVDVLLNVIKDYDLILLLEMEDTTGQVLSGLVDKLNAKSGKRFASIKSEPLKMSGRPEEYAFVYREDKVKVLEHFQYGGHEFSRPPFPVLVKATDIDLKFFLVPIHTRPRSTAAEIDALPKVFKKAAGKFSTQTGVILGDLNCGCEFLSNKGIRELKLMKDQSFYWWIKNDVTTTTKQGHSCPFDRIITHRGLTERVVNGSARAVYFDKEQHLKYEMTRLVSDHYPVTITLE